MFSFHYLNNVLHGEGINLESLLKEVGTPAYVYSARSIRDHFRELNHAFAPLENYRICYAVKANSNLTILRLLQEEGAWFDIVSAGELFKVLRAGGKAAQCTFAGVGKMSHEIEYALDEGIYSFNIESEEELELINDIAKRRGLKAPIALRVNPDVDTPTHHYISTGKNKNKFGIAFHRIEEIYAKVAALPHLAIRGIQTHIGSQILTATPFLEAIEKLAPLVMKIHQRYGLEFFSIGGGLGILYEGVLEKNAQSLEEQENSFLKAYAHALLRPLKALRLPIFFEPGRFLVGNAGVLLTQVLYRKETSEKNFLIVDAGMNDLIRPALYQGHHDIKPLKAKSREQEESLFEKVDVVGPVCESGDFFARDRLLPPLHAGDKLAILSVGAYGMVMGSNYNARPLPPEILLDGNTAKVIRRRQRWEDLIQGERTL